MMTTQSEPGDNAPQLTSQELHEQALAVFWAALDEYGANAGVVFSLEEARHLYKVGKRVAGKVGESEAQE